MIAPDTLLPDPTPEKNTKSTEARMTSRKTVSLVTLTVAGALALTACGGGHKAGELATPDPVTASLAKAESRPPRATRLGQPIVSWAAHADEPQ